MSFQSLGLSKPILRGVADAGYDTPTDIQRQAIPIALDGRNLIGLGETGSGKTAAYGLPLLERLSTSGERGLRAVILVPTRELCVQVAENLRIYASHTDLKVQTAFGGIPIQIQEAAFRRGLDVLVACPGRLIDHEGQGNVDLGKIECLVLDEADRMLDMGFIPQIQRILAELPEKRQNCLFSATMLPEIERLVKNYIGEAERVQIGKLSQAASTIVHRFEETRAEDKERTLEKVLRKRDGRVLIFVKRKTRAEALGRELKRAGLPADSIHGDKGAEQRHVVLKAFERGKIKHMVATDVAARGIDVSDIELVVNFDMPMVMEDYIHRVGRTGRAGGKGEALSLITRLDRRLLQQILGHLDTSSDAAADIIVDGKRVGGSKPKGERDRAPRDDRDRAVANGREDRGRDDRDRDDRDREDRSRGSSRGGRNRDRDRDRGGNSRDRDRGARAAREERPSREERPPREERPSREERPRRDERPRREERPRLDVAQSNVRLKKRAPKRDDAADVGWGNDPEPARSNGEGRGRRKR